MHSVVGIVDSIAEARRAGNAVLKAVPTARIRVLSPDASDAELASIPTDDAEQPGMGGALGAVAGGAAGAAAASLIVPPAGAIAIVGVAVAALLGGLGGMATGHAIEDSATFGLPRDELLYYADALRHGRYVVVALVEDDVDVDLARGALEATNAGSVDAAREAWWIGLRDAEADAYGDVEQFWTDEPPYRVGFEAACRGEDVTSTSVPSDVTRHPAFRAGWKRGRAYVEDQARRIAVTRPPIVDEPRERGRV